RTTYYTLSLSFFQCSPTTPDLHSFPTRRSSDLPQEDDDHLLPIPAPEPKDAERNEHGYRHVTHEAHEGVKDLAHALHAGTRVHSDRKSTRLNSSHLVISYAVFCLKKKKKKNQQH